MTLQIGNEIVGMLWQWSVWQLVHGKKYRINQMALYAKLETTFFYTSKQYMQTSTDWF